MGWDAYATRLATYAQHPRERLSPEDLQCFADAALERKRLGQLGSTLGYGTIGGPLEMAILMAASAVTVYDPNADDSQLFWTPDIVRHVHQHARWNAAPTGPWDMTGFLTDLWGQTVPIVSTFLGVCAREGLAIEFSW